MKKNCILLCLGLLFIVGCSKEEENTLPFQTHQFSDEAYQVKITKMEALFSTYGWSKDNQNIYDYKEPKNRKAIEELDLKELKEFLQEFSSEEGLRTRI